jgi:formylglycine-generating enzyme required for sulfatase activity
MYRTLPKWLQQGLVFGAAIVLTVLTVSATDSKETKRWLAATGAVNECTAEEVFVVVDGQALCVDVYEASANQSCPFKAVRTGRDNDTNLGINNCAAASQPAAPPLRYVSYTQAAHYCAQAGKRLPTAREWHGVAVKATADLTCNVSGQPPQVQLTGVAGCVTESGVYDLIGNVWEWVDGEVVNGTYNNRPVPPSGYVALVDTSGIVIETNSTSSQPVFEEAYAWVHPDGVGGIVKGGFYGSGSDAGRYAQQVGLPLGTQTGGIGFRCVRDVL